MADNEFDPPGWPFNEAPPPIPPAEPPRAPQPPTLPAPPTTPTAPPPPGQTYPPPAQPVSPPPPPGQTYPPPAQPVSPPPPAAPTHQVGQPPPYSSPGQPPPPPPGGWQAPPAAPRKGGRNVLITIAVIVGVLLLGIGSCTVWFVSTVKAPVDEANRFLAAVDQRDYETAAAMVPTGCDGSDINAQLLEGFFSDKPIEYNLTSSSISNNEATVSGSFSSPGTDVTGIEVFLRDRDGWQVCGFRFT